MSNFEKYSHMGSNGAQTFSRKLSFTIMLCLIFEVSKVYKQTYLSDQKISQTTKISVFFLEKRIESIFQNFFRIREKRDRNKQFKFSLYLQYKSMKKMNPMSLSDILKKRKAKIFSNKHKTEELDSRILTYQDEKDFTAVEDIIQKTIKRKPGNAPLQIEINEQEKNVIAEFMSEKACVSFNRNNIGALLKIWKYPHNHRLQLFQEGTVNLNIREDSRTIKRRKNYFVLKGKINLYDSKNYQQKRKSRGSVETRKKVIAKNLSDLEVITLERSTIVPLQVIEEFGTIGPIFKKNDISKSVIPIAVNAILIEIKQPDLETMIFNNGGIELQKKIEILQHFKIFDCLGKKLNTILPSIELKRYSRNEIIYRMCQESQAMYLIIKGQVKFETKISIPISKKGTFSPAKSQTNDFKNQNFELVPFQTETLGVGSYFGEQQIISQCQREQNAFCHSAECVLLEIPASKLAKVLVYSDFLDPLKKAMMTKKGQRRRKIKKAAQVFKNFCNNSEQKGLSKVPSCQAHKKKQTLRNSPSNTPPTKRSTPSVRVIHGTIIPKTTHVKVETPGEFSMLETNKDLYKSVKKKYRKQEFRPPKTKNKAEYKWKKKRIWEVLNLENVIRQDVDIGDPQGKKFFQSYRRFQNHVNQVKSIRPKTSSSTYRTKLQYIAYLQQFHNT